MDIKTQVTTNELGQTVIQLSKEDWETYGKQAGYWPEMTKQAETEETDEEAVEEVTEDDPQDTVTEASEEVEVKETAVDPNGGVGSPILIKEDSGFNAENYPNLIAEQEKDGLIGPFAPRK